MNDNRQNDGRMDNRSEQNGGDGGQQQQREGSLERQQNQQSDRQRDDDASIKPGLEESNRIDLDDEGHRDQQV